MRKHHRLLTTVAAVIVQRVRSALVQEQPTRRPGSVQFPTTSNSRAASLRLATLQALAGLVTALLLPAASATAENAYPSKPVRMIVSFAAGGPTDIVARIMGARMGEILGQQFVVENKTGAGGNIGADVVAKSPPDGYTLLMATVSTHAINPGLYRKIPYDPIGDFAPIGQVGVTPIMLVVHPSVPATDVKSLINLAKADASRIHLWLVRRRLDPSSLRRAIQSAGRRPQYPACALSRLVAADEGPDCRTDFHGL